MDNQETPKNTGNKKKVTLVIAGIVVLAIVVVLFFVGRNFGSLFSKNGNGLFGQKKNAIITVGDCGYALEDMMYYIYTEEETGAIMIRFIHNFMEFLTGKWKMSRMII